MFVLNPDPYSLPAFRIGPFQTKDLAYNHNLPENNLIDRYLNERFSGRHFNYTYNGRAAINAALSYYNPGRNDVVTVLTTSGNFYISGCVTGEIEKFCRWSRDIVPETILILVNHEFGYPFTDLQKIKQYNLPIIEDCAGSFFSTDKEHSTGTIGDFVIYSFPKMFPLQVGGLLVSSVKDSGIRPGIVEPGLLRYIRNVLS